MESLKNADETWLDALAQTYRGGRDVVSRGLDHREREDVQFKIPMLETLLQVPERKLSYKFAAAEPVWMLTGSDLVEDIAPFNPAMRKFAEENGRLFGAYGPKIIGQMSYVVDTLVNDPESRQAVINIWRENPVRSRDIPCTLSMQFRIRDGLLNTTVNMRSSDIWLGLPYDWFTFTVVSAQVAHFFSQAAHQLGPGVLTLNAGSSHLYHSDFFRTQEVLASATSVHQPMPLGLWKSFPTLIYWLNLQMQSREFIGWDT